MERERNGKKGKRNEIHFITWHKKNLKRKFKEKIKNKSKKLGKKILQILSPLLP